MSTHADPFSAVTLADVEAMHLLLRGHSVIDWHHLSFQSREEVDRFLRVNEFDPTDPKDIARLERIREDAVEYITQHLEYRLPNEIAIDAPAADLLLIASRKDHARLHACMILKVMHVMHHLEGREVLFRLPVSNDQIFGVVENKVMQVVEEMRGAGQPIVEFEWSRKEHSSLITKLLAKRETIAAHIYDKLRFRLVVRKQEDIPVLLQDMLHRLVPFNYVIPGQTVNSLVSFKSMIDSSVTLQTHKPFLQNSTEENIDSPNAFSGPGYRVLNFIADLPIRVSALLPNPSPEMAEQFDPRAVVFVLTEFQLMDLQTQQDNEQHENSHRAYKERQLALVKARLLQNTKA